MFKRRGAPKGNQNRRTHGYYSKVLDAEQQEAYERAVDVEGVDAEIAVMRMKLKSVLEKDPGNLKLIMQATNNLARLLSTKHQITEEEEKGLINGVKSVVKRIGEPLGIGIIKKTLNIP